jgi:hypothetical protein
MQKVDEPEVLTLRKDHTPALCEPIDFLVKENNLCYTSSTHTYAKEEEFSYADFKTDD